MTAPSSRSESLELGLAIKCAADIKPEKVHWLWEQRLPLGKCVLVAGEGGLGKSMVLAWLAATVSRGGEWPCREGHSSCGSVIILSAEDDAADTIVPRLMAAGADRSKIHIVSAVHKEDEKGRRTFNLQLDLPKLEKKITELNDVLLVEIDPITSYLGKVDSHKNAELRSVLEPLSEMAARLGVTMIGNTHLSKAAGGSANSRFIGSVAFVNHARAAFIVTADPEDSGRRLFIPSKTNLGRSREGLAYRIADTMIIGGDGKPIWAPYVKWEQSTVTMTADEAVAATDGGAEGRSAKEEAKDLLRELLSNGPVAAKEIQTAVKAHMISVATLRRAKSSLGVKVTRDGFGPGSTVIWTLPGHIDEHLCGSIDAHSQRNEHLCDKSQKPAETMSTYDEHLCESIDAQPTLIDAQKNRRKPIDAQTREVGTYAESERRSELCSDDGFPDLPAFLDRRRANASERS
jgi:RecA-family ATPase